LIVTSVLLIKRVKGAMILGIVFTSLLTLAVSEIGTRAGWLAQTLVTVPESFFALPTGDAFFKLDIAGALRFSMVMPIFALLFFDFFDFGCLLCGAGRSGGPGR
jgi:AGZA family xanthine/uracil permease-like MFS transporter